MTTPKPLKDFSLWSLVFSNLITIVIALVEQWSFLTLMWVYWFQSVIIGVFNIVRMLQLKKFSTEGFTSNGQPVPPTRKSQIETAVFFFFHYGFFHAGYLLFIWGGGFGGADPGFPVADAQFIAVSTAVFLGNHLLSYVQHRHETEDRVLNLGALMFYPYLRIIPMHLTIIFGGILGTALPVFLILKALADTGMHYVEHAVLMGKAPTTKKTNVQI
jgi:hypothetical protein